TLRVVLPASLPAIVTGIFLAIGRIAGETAPLLLTAGQSNFWPSSPAEQTPFLPGFIYNYSRSPQEDLRDQAGGVAPGPLGVGLVGLLILQRDRALFFDLANEVGAAVLLVIAVSVGLAFLLARRFARPLVELADGARRLAEGDFGHAIRVSGAREHAELAATF